MYRNNNSLVYALFLWDNSLVQYIHITLCGPRAVISFSFGVRILKTIRETHGRKVIELQLVYLIFFHCTKSEAFISCLKIFIFYVMWSISFLVRLHVMVIQRQSKLMGLQRNKNSSRQNNNKACFDMRDIVFYFEIRLITGCRPKYMRYIEMDKMGKCHK